MSTGITCEGQRYGLSGERCEGWQWQRAWSLDQEMDL